MRLRSPALLLTLLTLSALSGCRDRDEPEPFVERSTRVPHDAPGREFWTAPLPSALRLAEDGTMALHRFPAPRNALTEAWLRTAQDRSRDGWGLTNGVFFPIGGAIDPGTLPPTAEASLSHESSVYLVDIDPSSPERGRRFPLDVSFRADKGLTRPGNLLALMPVFGFVRRPGTLYAAVVTGRVKDANGEPLGRSEAFHAAFTGAEGLDPAQARAAEFLQPLRAWLKDEGLDPSEVIAATVFRTLDPNAALSRLVTLAESLPAPVVQGGWEAAEDFDDFRVYRGTWRVPNVQAGDRPGHGAILWGDDGAPVQNGWQQARLILSVPKRPMPAEGFPLMMYLHGSGGEAYEGIDRGPSNQDGPPPRPAAAPGTGPAAYLAKRGIGLLGFDFPLHGTRKTPPDTSGLEFYSLFGRLEDPYNIRQTLDNMTVAVMEVTYLTRLIGSIEVGDTGARFNPARLSAMGHSMGSTLGIIAAGVDPRVQGWVFSGSGGMLVEVAHSATYPVHLKPYVELLLGMPEGQTLTRDDPLLHVFQNLWDHVEPVARARHVAQEPLGERGPRPFLMTAGVTDGYFHPLAQQAVAVALGGTVIGPTVEETLPRAMALAGRAPIPYGADATVNGVTGGVVHHTSPFELGHYIVFNDPGPQSQYLCFVEGVGTPAGPRIVAPHDPATACDLSP